MRPGSPQLLVVLLGLAACIPDSVLRGTNPYAHEETLASPVPAGWRALAILPFGGDAAFRRPAEELAGLRLRDATTLGLKRPYAIRRWLVEQDGPDGAEAALQAASRWSAEAVERRALPADEVRALAARLQVDAVVVGAIAVGGRSIDLALVDGATSAPVAAVRRGGSDWAADLGPASRSADATTRALDALAVALRTPAGAVPAILPVPWSPPEAPW